MDLKSVKDADVRGRRVLLRTGLNVPINGGRVIDDFRLTRATKTIEYLLKEGAKVILIGHLGREGESVRPTLRALESHLRSVHINLIDKAPKDAVEETNALAVGSIISLENVRRFKGEEENDQSLAKAFASLCDIFVNDAFADSHRSHASIVGVAELLPSYAGFLVEEEVQKLSEALEPQHPSIAVIGGAKFETKEPLIQKLSNIYDRVCVGGAIVNDFFKAKGFNVGISLVSKKGPTNEMLNNPKVEIPIDILSATDSTSRATSPDDNHDDERIADAGPRTGDLWSDYIRDAQFVLMNGPLGIYEKGFNKETEKLAQALASSRARAVVGGGDTVAALQKQHFDPERIFLSTGGGAMLEFLASGTLPGLEPLKK